MSASSQSVSQWIAQLKDGQVDAAQQLWRRYSLRLVEIARRRMRDSPKSGADEEDVAANVFHSLCRGALAGRFQDVRNRDDLWWLLLAITKQKVVDHVRRETALKRGAGRTMHESGITDHARNRSEFTLDDLVGDEPTPDFLVSLDEEHQRLLGLLRDDGLRQIATSRIEGFTIPEIAEDLKISTRSIERKLQLIRGVWSKELQT